MRVGRARTAMRPCGRCADQPFARARRAIIEPPPALPGRVRFVCMGAIVMTLVVERVARMTLAVEHVARMTLAVEHFARPCAGNNDTHDADYVHML